VGSETERIVSYRRIPREMVLAEISAELTSGLIKAGADPDTVRTADIEETAMSYMADESIRIRVKMVGDLAIAKRGKS
jgi:hypothetical protein